MNLSQLCLAMGGGYAAIAMVFWVQGEKGIAWIQRFHRNVPWGVLLTLIATVWFQYLLADENLSDFASYKPVLQLVFGLAGVGSCFFLRDYLSIRGLSVLLLLIARIMVDTERWHSNGWKNVITVWAYLLVVMAIWFVISPWRARDWAMWNTESTRRFRLGCLVRAAFGIFVVLLGLTVLKG